MRNCEIPDLIDIFTTFSITFSTEKTYVINEGITHIYNRKKNIFYSANNYSKHTHTNTQWKRLSRSILRCVWVHDQWHISMTGPTILLTYDL